MTMKREITLTLKVIALATVGENEIENAINAALDEENGVDWGEWEVGPAIITNVRKFKSDAD
jgi:hypothetical protein